MKVKGMLLMAAALGMDFRQPVDYDISEPTIQTCPMCKEEFKTWGYGTCFCSHRCLLKSKEGNKPTPKKKKTRKQRKCL